MTTPNTEKLEDLILKYILENPGAQLADIATGPRLTEAGRLKPGKGVQLIHTMLPILEERHKVWQEHRRWYIR